MLSTSWKDDRQLAVCRAVLRRRRGRERAELDLRRERAWALGRCAAEILRRDFGAGRVVVFGSLARGSDFSEYSDVDLAVWGVPDDRFLGAIVEVAALSDNPIVNLVVAQTARPALLAVAEAEGVDV